MLITMLAKSFFPLAVMILSVFGAIMFGLATPTEAAAVGALGAMLLAAGYRALTWKALRESVFLSTIVAVVAVLAAAAGGIVFLVQRTTKADRSRSDIWWATAGFTVFIVTGAALVAWIYGATAAERVGTGTSSLSYIFAVAAMASLAAFFVVLLTYREPAADASAQAKPKRSVGRILLDMVFVLGNGRFSMYLVVMSGFYFIYNQVYNVLPLYVKKVVETSPAMDRNTAANPFVIVCFQLTLSRK